MSWFLLNEFVFGFNTKDLNEKKICLCESFSEKCSSSTCLNYDFT